MGYEVTVGRRMALSQLTQKNLRKYECISVI
jgi:hypothetical protein